MIRVQIVERKGAKLFSTLKRAMRTGDLRTFYMKNRGRKVTHSQYPGWIKWSSGEGVISCEILSPRKQAGEWQILGALTGRLADKYRADVAAINIQFPSTEDLPGGGRKGKART